MKDEDFLVYKDNDLLIRQSPALAKIQLTLRNIEFCDDSFFICPPIAYQVFITRVYSCTTQSYYTTSFRIMKNKYEKDYTKVFKVLNNNIKMYLDIRESYEIKEVDIDFGTAISKACKNTVNFMAIRFYFLE